MTQIPPAGEIEAFASLSRKAAGSQGRALSRTPQSPKSPFDFRFAKINQTLVSSARRSEQDSFARQARSYENQPHWVGFPFCRYRLIADQSGGLVVPLRRGNEGQRMGNLRFSSIAKKYSTGIFFTVRSKIAYRRSPRARTPAAYFKARSRPFGNPSSRSPFMTWPNKSATALRENTPPGYFLIPQGSRLCWHCAVHTYFMEQLRAEYRFSAVRALSAAVRPAFAVLICAPG